MLRLPNDIVGVSAREEVYARFDDCRSYILSKMVLPARVDTNVGRTGPLYPDLNQNWWKKINCHLHTDWKWQNNDLHRAARNWWKMEPVKELNCTEQPRIAEAIRISAELHRIVYKGCSWCKKINRSA